MRVTRLPILGVALALGITSSMSCADSEADNDSSSPDQSSEKDSDPEKPEEDPSAGTKEATESGGVKIDCSTLKPSGTEVGEIPPDVVLKDANGDDVSLHEHCNSIIYIIAGTAG